MIHLLSLAPALDLEAELRPPVSGKIGFLNRFSWSAGGKAVNLARFMRAWGLPFDMTLGTGGGSDPTHVLYESLLAAEGLRASYLDPGSPVRLNLVTRGGGPAAKYNHRGYPIRPSALRAFGRTALRFRRGDFCVLTGRVPEGKARAESARWVRAMESRGIHCVVDASGKSLSSFFRAKPSFFKVNLFEITEALGRPIGSLREFLSVLPVLRRRGLGRGVVTDGARGALSWEGREVLFGKTSRVSRGPRPVVGAGDAFLAGYLKAWREGKCLSDRVRWACASGAVVAQNGISGFSPGAVARATRMVRLSRAPISVRGMI